MPTAEGRNGGETLLEQLESFGVDCVFASPIAVMGPVWEALARSGAGMKLRYFRCRHELLAVSLASGYYKATGRSQVVFLPTSLGVQNAAMALGTAMKERTPMTVISPDTMTYGEDPDLDPGAEWPALLTGHAGPARSAEAVVKWSKLARTASDLVHEFRRACYIAESVPSGPTLLEVPFDLLQGPGHGQIPPRVGPAAVGASPAQIQEVADILAGATNPIIITEHAGRTDDDRNTLIAIAEALSAPVFEFWSPAYHNFPRSHPLYGAGPADPVVGEADAILLAGCDGPWHPPHPALRPGAAVIHLEQDPLRPNGAYWGYRTTHAIAGDVSVNLRAMAAVLQGRGSPVPGRAERWTAYSRGVRAEAAEKARASSEATGFVGSAEVFRALHDGLPDDAICVDEVTVPLAEMVHFLYERKPFTQYRGWCGGLGTSLGTALGVKLACPQKPVVCIIGDGAWHYNPVPAALGFAQEYGLGLLIVLWNNGQYASQSYNLLKYFPDGSAARAQNFIGNVIAPMPDYVRQVEAYGGAGERVQKLDELVPALRRALETIATGQTFLLDVIVEAQAFTVTKHDAGQGK